MTVFGGILLNIKRKSVTLDTKRVANLKTTLENMKVAAYSTQHNQTYIKKKASSDDQEIIHEYKKLPKSNRK